MRINVKERRRTTIRTESHTQLHVKAGLLHAMQQSCVDITAECHKKSSRFTLARTNASCFHPYLLMLCFGLDSKTDVYCHSERIAFDTSMDIVDSISSEPADYTETIS